MIRPILVLLHRYVGLATAVFLLIVGLTGSLLAYLQSLSAWLSPELYEAPARGVVLSPVELADRARAAEPRGVISSYPLKLAKGHGSACGWPRKIRRNPWAMTGCGSIR